MNLSWYAAKTKPQREEQAFASLIEHGFAAFLPRAHDMRLHHRKKSQIHDIRPLFTGYILVGFRPGAAHFGFAARCDGMGRFVTFNGTPEPFPASYVASLQERVFRGDFSTVMQERREKSEKAAAEAHRRALAAGMRKGDMVEVVDGLYASKGGVVSKIIKNRQRAVVEFEGLLGTMAKAEIDIGNLRAA